MSNLTVEKARLEGIDAFYADVPPDADEREGNLGTLYHIECPYEWGTPEYKAWYKAFHAEEREYLLDILGGCGDARDEPR